jgi:glutamate 5-kinase
VLDRILGGEDLGTVIPAVEARGARWRHIAISGRRQGALVVNDGALKALTTQKASLLPIGVLSVEGEFAKGDLVEIRDGSGRVHGRGLVNYDADDCRKVIGRRSEELDALLGAAHGYDALVTRDNLVMGGGV